MASATARVPDAKRSSSNMPMGPFQKTVPAPAISSANSAALPGPMSRPRQPFGTSRPTVRTPSPSVSAATTSLGRSTRFSAASRRRQCSTWSASSSESPTS